MEKSNEMNLEQIFFIITKKKGILLKYNKIQKLITK